MSNTGLVIQATKEDDLPNLQRLWNDGVVMTHVGYPQGLGISISEMQSWLAKLNPPQRHHYCIYLADGIFVGETFYSVDTASQTGALDIKLMPNFWGRGIARRALAFAIGQAFAKGQAERVYVEPHVDNKRALRLYQHLGFVKRHRPDYLAGKATYFEISKDDWNKSKIKAATDTDFYVEIRHADIILRDYLATDIADDIRWMTEETSWHKWDAPWEMEAALKKFDPIKFTAGTLEYLNRHRSHELLRTAFEVCTCKGIHIGGCNSYAIDANYEWMKSIENHRGPRAVGISICESSHWSKGYGTQILVAFIKYLLEQGIPALYTQTWSGNQRMVGLAQKLGFEICQSIKDKRHINGIYFDGLTFKLNVEKFWQFGNSN